MDRFVFVGRRVMLAVGVIGLSIGLACGGSSRSMGSNTDATDVSRNQLQEQWQTHFNAWNTAKINRYQFTVTEYVSLIPPRATRVTVENGIVTESKVIPNGTSIIDLSSTQNTVRAYGTVDLLFQAARTAINNTAIRTTITYDSKYHFPVSIVSDPLPPGGKPDSGRRIVVQDFVVLP